MAGDKKATAGKPQGYFRAEGWYGEVTERDTCQCSHCGCHFGIVKGSGKKRGYCLNCAQITCGRPQCDPCVHFMKKIEAAEAGKTPEQMPVKISVPAGVPKSHIKGGILLGGSGAVAE